MSYHNHLGFNAPDAIDTEAGKEELANAVCLVAACGKFEISLNGTFIRGNEGWAIVYFGLDRITERIDTSTAALIFAGIVTREEQP